MKIDNEILDKIIRASGYECRDKTNNLTSSAKLILIRMVGYFYETPQKPYSVSQAEISNMTGLEYKAVGKILRQFMGDGILLAAKETNKWDYYGIRSLTLIDTLSDTYDIPEMLCSEPVPTKSEKNQPPPTSGDFYVYVCKLKGTPVYVGKGKEGRISHCLSGCSGNADLNRLVFENSLSDFQVTKILEGVSESLALAKEKDVIESLTLVGYSLCNKMHVTTQKG
mgnify:CR=1 FL=1